MAITFETTPITFVSEGTTLGNAGVEISSDDVTLDPDAIDREIFVSLTNSGDQLAGESVDVYWTEKSDTLYTTQARYLGTVDVGDNLASGAANNKSLGLSSAMSTGKLSFICDGTASFGVTITAANLHERSTA